MKQPVRGMTDADATDPNQSGVTDLFCGKLFQCPATLVACARYRQKSRENPGYLVIHSQAADLHGGPAPCPRASSRTASADDAAFWDFPLPDFVERTG
jgi:hypothetical protein